MPWSRATTSVGEDTWILAHAVIGGVPQDLKYRGEPTPSCVIGDRNRIRECVTINTGTEEGRRRHASSATTAS